MCSHDLPLPPLPRRHCHPHPLEVASWNPLSWVLAGVVAVYVFSDKNNGMNLGGYLWQKKRLKEECSQSQSYF
jgi:hypothetical protein